VQCHCYASAAAMDEPQKQKKITLNPFRLTIQIHWCILKVNGIIANIIIMLKMQI
jgi:hypothetical protein